MHLAPLAAPAAAMLLWRSELVTPGWAARLRAGTPARSNSRWSPQVKVGEFRPAVRAPGLVLPLHVRVGWIDRMGPMAKDAGDVDDPGRGGGQDAGHQLGGECPVSKVVHAELQVRSHRRCAVRGWP